MSARVAIFIAVLAFVAFLAYTDNLGISLGN